MSNIWLSHYFTLSCAKADCLGFTSEFPQQELFHESVRLSLLPCDKYLSQWRAKWDLLHCLNYWSGQSEKFMGQNSSTFPMHNVLICFQPQFALTASSLLHCTQSHVTLCKRADKMRCATPKKCTRWCAQLSNGLAVGWFFFFFL